MVTVKELSGVRLIPGDWELNKVLLCVWMQWEGLGTCCVLAWSTLLPGTLWSAPKLPLGVCLVASCQ